MSADGPDPSGDWGRGRAIIDPTTGEAAEVVGGALKTTGGGGGGGTVDQGSPAAPANAWPVKPTDAAGVNQQAITATGDAKVTLDGEAVAISGTVPVSGPLTDVQLRASDVKISLDGEQVDVSDRATRAAGTIRIEDNPTGARVGDIASGCLDVTVGSQVVQVDGSGVTQPVSAASLPLPTNAAREHATAASPHSVRLSDGAAFYVGAKTGQLPGSLGASGALMVEGRTNHDGTSVANPVLIGGVASAAAPADVSNDGDLTQPWYLRSGAQVGQLSAAGALIGGDAANGLDVDVTRSALPTGAATSALQTQPGVDIGDVTVNNAPGAAAVNVQDGGNSLTVDAVSLPLPTGAATEAKQDTGNTSLASLDAKIGTLEDRPSAYSVLDRLYQIGKKLDTIIATHATEATLKKFVAPAPSRSPLLFRHFLGR